MKKQAIHTAAAPKPVARYSQGIRVGETLYVQGTIGLDPATNAMVPGGVEAQAQRVFQSLEAILAAAGMTFAEVVKVNAYLADLSDFPVFNRIYGAIFTSEPPPVRTTVQAQLPLGALVEVDLIACASSV